MMKKTRYLVKSAMIAALYVAITYLQNLLIPDSATWAVQFRAAEALCVLAVFTPAAIPGLTLGCLLFNITYAQALPLDFLIGSLASLLATLFMWRSRHLTWRGYPLVGMLMPAVFNALLVGWELSVYIGGGFVVNALSVALGELGVLLTLGSALYYAIKKRKLDEKLF